MLNPSKKWKNVHLEAGLRSGSLSEPFPEEIVRRVTDSFSDILLAVSDLSSRNLKKERPFFVHGKIINAGNTVVDSAAIAYGMAKKEYRKPKQEYALINMHRHENLKSEKRMRKIVEIVKNLEIRAIWPMHENTREAFTALGMMRELEKIKNLEIRPLCSYPEFVFLEANCRYLVVDGGSIQEESLIFGKPCILLREKTERQEGLATGINFLTKLDADYTKKTVEKILSKDFKVPKFRNPYGKEGLSKKIVEMLR
jgi:UDP-N-acetylglucosamine 2-epimerase